MNGVIPMRGSMLIYEGLSSRRILALIYHHL